jgi:hypothetical protein
MSVLYDQVEQQARLLSPEERARLVHLLIEELDSLDKGEVKELWGCRSTTQVSSVPEGRP